MKASKTTKLSRAEAEAAMTMPPLYPDIVLRGEELDGNALALVTAARAAMRYAGITELELDEFAREALSSDYDHVLRTVGSRVWLLWKPRWSARRRSPAATKDSKDKSRVGHRISLVGRRKQARRAQMPVPLPRRLASPRAVLQGEPAMYDAFNVPCSENHLNGEETAAAQVRTFQFHSARLKLFTRLPVEAGRPIRPILTTFWNPATRLPLGGALMPHWPDPYEVGAAAVDGGGIVAGAERLSPGSTDTSVEEDEAFRVYWRPVSRTRGALLRSARNGGRRAREADQGDRREWRRWFLAMTEVLHTSLGRQPCGTTVGYDELLAALRVAFASAPLASRPSNVIPWPR